MKVSEMLMSGTATTFSYCDGESDECHDYHIDNVTVRNGVVQLVGSSSNRSLVFEFEDFNHHSSSEDNRPMPVVGHIVEHGQPSTYTTYIMLYAESEMRVSEMIEQGLIKTCVAHGSEDRYSINYHAVKHGEVRFSCTNKSGGVLFTFEDFVHVSDEKSYGIVVVGQDVTNDPPRRTIMTLEVVKR